MSVYDVAKKHLKAALGWDYDILKAHNCILAGGAIASIFTNREVNDWDIYFRSPDDFRNLMTGEYLGRYILHRSKKAVLFAPVSGGADNIQLICFKFFEKPEDIFETYDFYCVMGAFDFVTEEFIFHPRFFVDNARRELNFNVNTAFPLMSELRISKYEDRGYSISNSERIRVLLAVSKLNIDSWEELERHIGGMYGDRLDELPKDEPFSLERAMEALHEDVFASPRAEEAGCDMFDGDRERLVDNLLGIKTPVYEHHGAYYRETEQGYNQITDKLDESYAEPVPLASHLKAPLYRYKYVRPMGDGTYCSYFDQKFKYEIGRIVQTDNPHGLYCTDLSNVALTTYSNQLDKVMVELAILDVDDIMNLDGIKEGTTQVKRAYVVREVPKEDVGKVELDDLWPF